MKLYCAYTKDKYELPVAIETSIGILARKLGVKERTIKNYLASGQKAKGRYNVIKLELEVESD